MPLLRATVCAVVVAGFVLGGQRTAEADAAQAQAPAAQPMPTRAAGTGDIPDNPLLTAVPADTPWVFATFKPVPLDSLRGLVDLLGPPAKRGFTEYMVNGNAVEQRAGRQLLADLAAMDVKRFEEIGFATKARLVVYGLAGHVVVRFELSDGNRLFNSMRRWNDGSAAPVARAGRHYWISGTSGSAIFVAVGAKEMVATIAPRDVIRANLDLLLGARRPAKSLTTAELRALAQRDGFTGQGVGFVDVTRTAGLIADLAGAGAECRTALVAMGKSVPRIALGLDDITAQRFAIGVVLDVPADAVGELRGLATSLAGFDRLLRHRPLAAVAAAANIERVRPLVSRVASGLGDLGRACELPDVVGAMEGMGDAAARPLPPFLAGLRGGFVVLDDMKLGPRGPESMAGFGVAQLDHTGELLKLVPKLGLKADGKAHPLVGAIPWPSHLAASQTTIGVAVGPGSETTAVDLLAAKGAPAPLALLQLDYARIAGMTPSLAAKADERRIAEALGLVTMQLVADDRGVVLWTSFDLH